MGSLSNLEKHHFYYHIAIFQKAGMPLDQSVGLLAEKHASRPMADILAYIHFSLGEGIAFHDALRKFPDIFPAYECDLLESSPDSFIQSLEWLAEMSISGHERSRVTRTLFWVALFSAIGAIILYYLFIVLLIPVFEEMFRSMGTDLPTPTWLLIRSCNLVRGHSMVILAVVVPVLLLYRFLRKNHSETFSLVLTFTPWIGRKWMVREFILFSRILGKSMAFGVPAGKAIDGAADYVSHDYLKQRLRASGRAITGGAGWANAFTTIRRLPGFFVSLIRMGEERGELHETFLEIYQTEKQEQPAMDLMLLLVPGFVCVVFFVFIGFSVIAMYLPFFHIAGVL